MKQTQRQRRLLVVTPYFAAHGGGIESVAWQLIHHLSAEAPTLQIEWMASDCDPPPAPATPSVRFSPARSWNGVEHKSGLPVPIWSLGAIGRLWRAIKRSDVVHFHDVAYLSSIMSALFCRWQHKPYFVTQHTGFVEHPNRWMRALRDWINHVPGRQMLTHAEAVVFISDEVRRAFLPLLLDQTLRFIPNGVDTRVFCDASDEERARQRRSLCHELNLDESRPLLLFVGRFVAMKGILIMSELSRQFLDCNWIFAGAGPLDPTSSVGDNGRVVQGRRGTTLAEVYRSADLLLLPSYSEGFPLVVQEALACGTPVLIERKIGEASPNARQWMNFETLDASSNDTERWALKLRLMLDEMSTQDNTENQSRHERAAWAHHEWNWERCAQEYLELFASKFANHTR